MKINYILIPLFTLMVSVLGSIVTERGMKWYRTINLPSWTPDGSVIGAVWTTIFILSTISALVLWNGMPKDERFVWIFGLFVANGLLNFFWSYLFFGKHMLGLATFEAILLDLSVIALIVLIWPFKIWPALLLMPYAFWVAFASYLTYSVWSLNK